MKADKSQRVSRAPAVDPALEIVLTLPVSKADFVTVEDPLKKALAAMARVPHEDVTVVSREEVDSRSKLTALKAQEARDMLVAEVT